MRTGLADQLKGDAVVLQLPMESLSYFRIVVAVTEKSDVLQRNNVGHPDTLPSCRNHYKAVCHPKPKHMFPK